MVRKIEFVPNKDGITTSFIVNSQVLDAEVPFVPRKLVDSRGIAMWQYCREKNINIETDVEFINETWDEKTEIKRLFDYMLNPVYVRKTVKEITDQKVYHRRNSA